MRTNVDSYKNECGCDRHTVSLSDMTEDELAAFQSALSFHGTVLSLGILKSMLQSRAIARVKERLAK